MTSAVIIGSGNVATCLGKAFQKAGIAIRAVYSPTILHVQQLADELKSEAINQVSELPVDADLYLLAVKDDVIEQVSAELPLVHGIIVHCSGMASMELLNKHKNYGVLWPAQTITKNSVFNREALPFCLEGNNEVTTHQLNELVNRISDKIVVMNSEQRKYVHLAAVFANNFSNHLFRVAEQILISNNLSFDLIRPMILETAGKVQQVSPGMVQTGPAKRNDTTTMEQHLQLLETYPEYRQLYELLSESIRQHNQ